MGVLERGLEENNAIPMPTGTIVGRMTTIRASTVAGNIYQV